MTVKLEVGKKYVTRSGEVVTLIDSDGSEMYPHRFSNGVDYTNDGRELYTDKSDHDIIAEYHDYKDVGTLKEIGAQVDDVVEMLTVRSGYSMPEGQLTIDSFGNAIAENGGLYAAYHDECYGRTYRIISRANPFQPQTCHLSHPVTLDEVTQPSLDDQIKAARKDVKRAKKRLRKLRKEKAREVKSVESPMFDADQMRSVLERYAARAEAELLKGVQND